MKEILKKLFLFMAVPYLMLLLPNPPYMNDGGGF